MIPTARDLMQAGVISVHASASLGDVYRVLREAEISGAPVVDDGDNLVGVITSSDLLRALDEERGTAEFETDYFRDLLPYSSPDWSSFPEDLQDRLGARRVEDAMTTGLIAVDVTTAAPEIARELRKNRVHRVFVLDEGRLVGVVSAFDLLSLVEEWTLAPAHPSEEP